MPSSTARMIPMAKETIPLLPTLDNNPEVKWEGSKDGMRFRDSAHGQGETTPLPLTFGNDPEVKREESEEESEFCKEGCEEECAEGCQEYAEGCPECAEGCPEFVEGCPECAEGCPECHNPLHSLEHIPRHLFYILLRNSLHNPPPPPSSRPLSSHPCSNSQSSGI